jgi:AcrR family transcriptional regulator
VTPPRRTQAERRAATINRLVDATIEAIAEVGYARASLGEICARSGVSRGGLFRHFDSRQALLLAAAREVGRRHIEAAAKTMAEAGGVAEGVRLVRSRVRATENVVWFELLVAARTDDDLRAGLAPIAEEFIAQTVAVARDTLPPEVSDDDVALVVTTLEHAFDGEAIRREVLLDPALEARRLELLTEVARRALFPEP